MPKKSKQKDDATALLRSVLCKNQIKKNQSAAVNEWMEYITQCSNARLNGEHKALSLILQSMITLSQEEIIQRLNIAISQGDINIASLILGHDDIILPLAQLVSLFNLAMENNHIQIAQCIFGITAIDYEEHPAEVQSMLNFPHFSLSLSTANYLIEIVTEQGNSRIQNLLADFSRRLSEAEDVIEDADNNNDIIYVIQAAGEEVIVREYIEVEVESEISAAPELDVYTAANDTTQELACDISSAWASS